MGEVGSDIGDGRPLVESAVLLWLRVPASPAAGWGIGGTAWARSRLGLFEGPLGVQVSRPVPILHLGVGYATLVKNITEQTVSK